MEGRKEGSRELRQTGRAVLGADIDAPARGKKDTENIDRTELGNGNNDGLIYNTNKKARSAR